LTAESVADEDGVVGNRKEDGSRRRGLSPQQ